MGMDSKSDRRGDGHPGGVMNVESVMTPTEMAHRGMLVRELFEICGREHVQALPFGDAGGRITGRVTLKNVLRLSCLPEYIVEMASLLTSRLSCVESAEEKAREIIGNPIDSYVQEMPHQAISSDAPLIKALALMEKNDTSYVFVVDEGLYRGIITIQGIAAIMSGLPVAVPGAPAGNTR